MPTAGRLFGGIAFAIFGALLAYLTAPVFEEGKLPSYWYPLCILAGLWSGWVVVGKRVGGGFGNGVSIGLTGVAAMVFWILFILGFMIMIQKSMRGAYGGPVQAVVNVFQQMYEQALALYSPFLIGVILVGSIVCGLIAEFFGRRFP